MDHRHETLRASPQRRHEAGPVFADSSGRRRRRLRALATVASVVLVAALIMAGVGLFGGPDTPFSVFGAPVVHPHKHPARVGGGGHHRAGRPVPGSVSAAPSASADPSPAPTPTSSPAPTNKAGKTPPGLSRSHKPHPSPSRPGQ